MDCGCQGCGSLALFLRGMTWIFCGLIQGPNRPNQIICAVTNSSVKSRSISLTSEPRLEGNRSCGSIHSHIHPHNTNGLDLVCASDVPLFLCYNGTLQLQLDTGKSLCWKVLYLALSWVIFSQIVQWLNKLVNPNPPTHRLVVVLEDRAEAN